MSRAELMFVLVQRLADLGAEAERRSRRPVPRLNNDLALVDQFRVVTADLLRAPAEEDQLSQADAAITEVLRRLS